MKRKRASTLQAETKAAHLSLLQEIQPLLQKHAHGKERLHKEDKDRILEILRWTEEQNHYPRYTHYLRQLLHSPPPHAL